MLTVYVDSSLQMSDKTNVGEVKKIPLQNNRCKLWNWIFQSGCMELKLKKKKNTSCEREALWNLPAGKFKDSSTYKHDFYLVYIKLYNKTNK